MMLRTSPRPNFACAGNSDLPQRSAQAKNILGRAKRKRKSGSYNKTKKRTLEILENKTWLDVPAIARKVGIRPVRRAYTYIAHLEKLGLVTRGWDAPDAPGKLHFQITTRGLERLQWLRLQNDTTTIGELIAPFLR